MLAPTLNVRQHYRQTRSFWRVCTSGFSTSLLTWPRQLLVKNVWAITAMLL